MSRFWRFLPVTLWLFQPGPNSAMGYNLWGWLPKWTDEDIRFVTEDPQETSGKDDLLIIPMVLTSLEIYEPLYPTWLPDDLMRIESVFEEDPFILHEAYSGNGRFLSITISPITGSESAVYQKEQNSPQEYTRNNTVHFIFANTNEITAVWYTENYTVLIVGNITFDEMKQIIDSVYEVKNE